MSVFDDRRDLLDHLEFKYGVVRGRLAATMDILTDAQVAIGAHAAYCKQPRDPSRPTRDIEEVLKQLGDAKELLADVLAALGKTS